MRVYTTALAWMDGDVLFDGLSKRGLAASPDKLSRDDGTVSTEADGRYAAKL